MNLYLLTQNESTGYDTFDSCIVCAETESEAKAIFPDGSENGFEMQEHLKKLGMSWASCPENVRCELIGLAKDAVKKGVIIASFNAG